MLQHKHTHTHIEFISRNSIEYIRTIRAPDNATNSNTKINFLKHEQETILSNIFNSSGLGYVAMCTVRPSLAIPFALIVFKFIEYNFVAAF